MKYEGITCPQCGEAFTNDSDVVVCPECGTPHHRACYEKNGKCIYNDKHGEDFAWVNPKASEEALKPTKKVDAVPVGVNKEDMPKNGVIGEMNVDQRGNVQSSYREIKGNEKIGEFTVDEYAKVVQKNVPKFMPRFFMFSKTDRKVSWNWAAFFFGPLYLAYRKMVKAAAIAMLLIYIIPLICYTEVSDYYTEVSDMSTKLMTSEAFETSEEMEEAISNYEANLPEEPRAITVSSYIETGISILCGLFANYLYYTKCTKVLDASKKIEDIEKKDKYLARRGGRSLFSAIMFMILFDVFVALVATVYTALGTDLATVLRKFIK